MRLIDADALLSKHCIALNGPNNGEYDSCSECLREPYGCCCMEMNGDEIYEAPTIDAIPVEWLKRKSLDANDPFSPYMMVMFAWYQEQKEQEAQDGD